MRKSMGALLMSAALTGLAATLGADALAQPNGGAMSASGGNAVDPSGGAGVPAGRVKHRHRKGKDGCKGKDKRKLKDKGKGKDKSKIKFK
jgi:hypothetical protein